MRIRALITLPLLVWIAGCAETDPYQRTGSWQPTGANAINLAAMVANPADLVRGRGERTSIGREAGPPVDRLLSGKPTPLPNASSQSASSGPAAQAPGAN